MLILSHRGYWKDAAEKNLDVAFRRSIACGFGTETDVRDLAGRLVISHDPPARVEVDLRQVLDLFRGRGLTLAMNIKADGLAVALRDAFEAAEVPWFAFDMSGPETLRYLALGLPTFTRHSDIETAPICYDRAQGVWLDAFESDWYGAEDVRAHLARGKTVCLVSPDLHRRPHQDVWRWVRSSGLSGHPDLMLCTDYPEEARAFFGDTP